MHNSSIRGGYGNDRLNILASVLDSFLDMGYGDDIINIAGDLINSTLAMGDGDDSVFIGGGVSNSSIRCEAGFTLDTGKALGRSIGV